MVNRKVERQGFEKLNVLVVDELDVVLGIYDLERTAPSRPAMLRSLSQPPLEQPRAKILNLKQELFTDQARGRREDSE